MANKRRPDREQTAVRGWLAFLATLALASPAFGAPDQRCDAPEHLTAPHAHLPHVGLAIKRGQKIDVIVLSGTPSQMGGGDFPRSYPSFLESALRERLPNIPIRVLVRTAPRRTVMEVVPALPKLINEDKPTLVVWQSGTVEAYRGIDADGFGRSLERGLTTMLGGGVDVVLVNMQYSPRTDFVIDVASYTEAMRWVAQAKDVPFFNRYQIMRYWSESGVFELSAFRIARKEFEEIHRCIGSLIADTIVRAAAASEGSR